MPAPPTDDEVLAARRMFVQHRRRRFPDRSRCGFCGQLWQTGYTAAGRPARGCPRRRRAASVLDAAGLLDERGWPNTP